MNEIGTLLESITTKIFLENQRKHKIPCKDFAFHWTNEYTNADNKGTKAKGS